jgi:hypothetical protein
VLTGNFRVLETLGTDSACRLCAGAETEAGPPGNPRGHGGEEHGHVVYEVGSINITDLSLYGTYMCLKISLKGKHFFCHPTNFKREICKIYSR